VIAISHAGDMMDNLIAAQVPGIDVIVGGHSHSRLPTGEFVWRSEDLKENDVNGTVIVQAHQWGGEIGRLDLLFARDRKGMWHVDRYRARLIPVTPNIPADAGVAAVVDRYWQPISARYGEVIGQAEADFSSRGDDEAPYNLVADAVRETFGTEIELENTGGVRAPLIKGPITRGDMVTLDPFNNTVVLFKIAGRDLKRILWQNRPAVSGIRYRVENAELVEATVDGRPIEDDRTYTGATNSYFAQSGLKGIETEDTGRARLDVVIDYVRKKGTVKPVYDGRRVVGR
jgi:5'-nucleotidase